MAGIMDLLAQIMMRGRSGPQTMQQPQDPMQDQYVGMNFADSRFPDISMGSQSARSGLSDMSQPYGVFSDPNDPSQRRRDLAALMQPPSDPRYTPPGEQYARDMEMGRGRADAFMSTGMTPADPEQPSIPDPTKMATTRMQIEAESPLMRAKIDELESESNYNRSRSGYYDEYAGLREAQSEGVMDPDGKPLSASDVAQVRMARSGLVKEYQEKFTKYGKLKNTEKMTPEELAEMGTYKERIAKLDRFLDSGLANKFGGAPADPTNGGTRMIDKPASPTLGVDDAMTSGTQSIDVDLDGGARGGGIDSMSPADRAELEKKLRDDPAFKRWYMQNMGSR